MMDLVVDQLLARFRIQCSKHVRNYPFLMGQGVWIDSEKLSENDSVAEILKHGTLSMGFIGLAECLKALIGVHHGESPEAQKLGLDIITRMRKRMDEYRAAMKEIAAERGIPCIDLQEEFVHILQYRYPAFITWDRIHPGMVGSVIIAKAFLREIGFGRGR